MNQKINEKWDAFFFYLFESDKPYIQYMFMALHDVQFFNSVLLKKNHSIFGV